MKQEILCLTCLVPLLALAQPQAGPAGDGDQTEMEFSLTTGYFDKEAVSLADYPFTLNLAKIDKSLAGEYSYCWSTGGPATRHVVQAACLGEHDKVLLGWWRSKDRASRVAALAVHYCQSKDPDMSPFPRFAEDAARFGGEEAAQRMEEIRFVRTNVPYFRKWLANLVVDNVPADAAFLKGIEGPVDSKPSIPGK